MHPYFFERYLALRRGEIDLAAKAHQRELDARTDALEPDQPASARPVNHGSAPFGLRFLRRAS